MLITCKECGGKYSDQVENCIHCGALTSYNKDISNDINENNEKKDSNINQNKDNGMADTVAGIIALIIIIFIIIKIFSGISSLFNDSDSKADKDISSTLSENKVYNIGDRIITDKFELTVTFVEERGKVGERYFNSEPSEGATYVAVQYKYKNISSEPISSWDLPIIKLIDASGTKYSTDINASSNYATETHPDSKVFSDLNPQITVYDSDVFEISKEEYAKGTWYLLIENKIKVKIK